MFLAYARVFLRRKPCGFVRAENAFAAGSLGPNPVPFGVLGLVSPTYLHLGAPAPLGGWHLCVGGLLERPPVD